MIGNYIIRLEQIDSTNRYATELLTNQYTLQEGTVIMASHQSAGKGASENKWESERGKNLTLSIILFPSFLPLEKQFMINKIVSLGVFDMIEKLVGNKGKVTIKWPNDIYVDKKKIAGILIENATMGSEFQHFILGIGININQEIFMSDAPNPVSLKIVKGKDHDLGECLSVLCSCVEKRYTQLKTMQDDLINADYKSALFRIDETALYIYHEQTIEAKITGISKHGKLLLEKTDGTGLDCDFKEVEFVL
jgi:BirA family transcriptional regulator, biotin operon repressor / biotin---[acetyl-CoA-carboxylase] ligase